MSKKKDTQFDLKAKSIKHEIKDFIFKKSHISFELPKYPFKKLKEQLIFLKKKI